MSKCTDIQARLIMRNYQQQLDEIKQKIRKNFSEMDLENNSAKEDMDDIIVKIESECIKLSNYIEREKSSIRG
ncbi:MAG: hypothetical protein ACLR60_03140 [Clostridium paraputrificum]